MRIDSLHGLQADFSFSRGLATHRGTGEHLIATSYDSESKVKSKYSNAQECIQSIRKAQGHVLHDVDATDLQQALPRQLSDGTRVPPFFSRIVFNFPHSGQQRVHINRALLLDFFESARSKVERDGEVHVSLKTRPPYSNWLIEDQAKAAGFVLKERRPFNIRLFPGYHHRTTDPTAKKFEADLCVTYVFIVHRGKVMTGLIGHWSLCVDLMRCCACLQHPFEPILKAQQEQERELESQGSSEQREEEAQKPVVQIVAAPAAKESRDAPPRKKVKARAAPVPVPVKPSQELKPRIRTQRQTLWRPLHRRAL